MSKVRFATIAAAAASVVAVAVPAVAAAGDDDVRSAGKCNGSSTAKIKAKPDDGRIEVEFEVDQNRNGVRWKVRLKDNGDVVFRGSRKTRGPSGSFSLERRQIMRAYGAKVVLTPATERASGAVRWAARLAEERGWFLAQQFDNEANPAYHRQTTGAEILSDGAGSTAAASAASRARSQATA